MRLPGLITKEILAMALDSVRTNKFRSMLTMLGIVIGVLTVIIVAAMLTGLRGNLVRIVEEYGVNNIYAFHLTTGIHVGERDQGERARKVLTPDDGEAIEGRRARSRTWPSSRRTSATTAGRSTTRSLSG